MKNTITNAVAFAEVYSVTLVNNPSRRELERKGVAAVSTIKDLAMKLTIAEEVIRRIGELGGIPEDKIQEAIDIIGD